MATQLHIVSFDVPYPADYGGVIDVFNRLKALHHAGFEITLHSFDYGRGLQSELDNYTAKVHYYKRKSKAINILKKEPMIVASRKSQFLLKNLLENDAPILFEGQHTTGLLNHPALKNRKKLVRLHNIEHEYYDGLSETVSFGYKKTFFKTEARKLKKHEHVFMHADALLCLHPEDMDYYQRLHKSVNLLPPVYDLYQPDFSWSKADYVLFHGNLSVGENIEAAKWIMNEVVRYSDRTFYFAGKNPSNDLKKSARQYENCKIIANPSEEELNKLMNEAKAHLLITFRPSGIKLKLLKALSTSSPVICNTEMAAGTFLNEHCVIGNNSKQILNALLTTNSLSEKQHRLRIEAIKKRYSSEAHVELIRRLLS